MARTKKSPAFGKWAIGGLLFLLPFFVYPNGGVDMELQFNAPKLIGAFLIGNLCFGFYLSHKISWYFGFAHIAVVFSVLLTGFGPMQMYPFAYWSAAAMLALWFTGRDPVEQIFYLKTLALSGVVVAMHAFLQTLGFTWPLHYAEGIEQFHPIAFMGQHTKLGAFLAPISVLCFTFGKKRGAAVLWHLAAAFTALVVVLTTSSFSMLALGAGLFVAIRHKIGRKKTLMLALGGLALLYSAYLLNPAAEEFNENGRSAVWRETVQGYKHAPYLGHGLGAFQQNFAREFESQSTGGRYGSFRQAHNDYLQLLYDCGAFGGLCLLIVLFGVAYSYYRDWWRESMPNTSACAAQAMLAALLANAVGNFPFQLSPHFLIGVLSAAILLKSAREAATIFAWPLIHYLRSST